MDANSMWLQFLQAICMLAGVLFLVATLFLLLYVTKLVCSVPSMFQDELGEPKSEDFERPGITIVEIPPPSKKRSVSMSELNGGSAVSKSYDSEGEEVMVIRYPQQDTSEVPPPDADEFCVLGDASDPAAGPAQPYEAVGEKIRAEASGDSKTSDGAFGRISKVKGLALNVGPGIPVSVNITGGAGSTAEGVSWKPTCTSASETVRGLTGSSSTLRITEI